MVSNQLCRQSDTSNIGATHIETPLEPNDLFIALKQPDFLIAALNMRKEGFLSSSSDRYVS